MFQRYCPPGEQLIQLEQLMLAGLVNIGHIPFKEPNDMFEYTLTLIFDRRIINERIDSWNEIGGTPLFYNKQKVLVYWNPDELRPFFETPEREYRVVVGEGNECTIYHCDGCSLPKILGTCQFNVQSKVRVKVKGFELTTG